MVVVIVGIIAVVGSRLVPLDAIGIYQLLLAALGVAYVFASVLAWTGFANLYRYSPTLYIGSRSYRRSIVRDPVWREGRDAEALSLGVLFGLALVATGVALSGWLFALLVLVGTVAVLLFLRSIATGRAKPS